MRILPAIAALALALPLQAQTVEKRFEVSPFVGYLFGGPVYDFSLDSPLPASNVRVDLADHVSYGVRLGYKAGKRFQPEFQWTHVESVLRSSKSSISPPDLPLNLDYLLAGISYNFTHGRTQPYASVSLGALRLSPTFPQDVTQSHAGNEFRFTGSLGLGLKHFLTPSVGLRFEAKGCASRIAHVRFGPICTTFVGSDPGGPIIPVTAPCPTKPWLLNGELGGGLLFAF